MSLIRDDIDRIVTEARVKNTTPSLYGASLRAEDLSGVDLSEVNLRNADLQMANLRGADLRGANLSGAQLTMTDLSGADLFGAKLISADLFGAKLHGTNLISADLHGASLHGADGTGLLRLDGLPMGQATLVPTWQGWTLTVGGWKGTVEGLRDSITKGDWPVPEGENQYLHRRELELLADLCYIHIARHPGLIAGLDDRWGGK